MLTTLNRLKENYLNPIKNPIFYCGIAQSWLFCTFTIKKIAYHEFFEEKKQKLLSFGIKRLQRHLLSKVKNKLKQKKVANVIQNLFALF